MRYIMVVHKVTRPSLKGSFKKPKPHLGWKNYLKRFKSGINIQHLMWE